MTAHTVTTDEQATFLKLAGFLNKGNAHIVSAYFCDWLEKHNDSLPGKLKGLHTRFRTLPNPDRLGILDQYIAFTTFKGMHFHVDGILKMDGKPITATVACDTHSDGLRFLGLWFVGFNNSCQWKGNLTPDDIRDLIATKTIRLAPPMKYANGKEVWE